MYNENFYRNNYEYHYNNRTCCLPKAEAPPERKTNCSRHPVCGIAAECILWSGVDDDAAAIMNSSDLTSVLSGKSYKAGDTATVAYVRDGQVYTTGITFGSTAEKPAETAQSKQQAQVPQNRQQSSEGAYLYPDMESFFNEFFDGYDFGG